MDESAFVAQRKMTVLSIAHLPPMLPPAMSLSGTVPPRDRRLICTATNNGNGSNQAL